MAVNVIYISAVIFFFFIACLIWAGHPLALYGDNLVQNLPFFYEIYRQFHSGHIPLYNPYIFGGQSLIGNPISGTFYLFYWMPFSFLPVYRAFDFLWFLHVVIASTGMFFLLRYHGLSKIPSSVGALLFGLNGSVSILFGTLCIQMLASLSWLPFVILFFERLHERPSFGNSLLFFIVLLVQFLSAYPQFLLYSLILALLFVLLFHKGITGRLKLLLKNYLFVILLILLFIVPFYKIQSSFMAMTFRNVKIGFTPGISFSEYMDLFIWKKQLLGLFLPGIEVPWLNIRTYSGPLFLGFLSIFGITCSFFSKMKKVKILAWALFLLSIALTIGPENYLQRILYHVPILNLFRGAFKMLLITAFSGTILSVIGLEAFLDKGFSIKMPFIMLFSCIFWGGSLLFSFNCVIIEPFSKGLLLFSIIIFSLFFVYHLLAVKNGNIRTHRIKFFLIFSLALLDLFYFGHVLADFNNSLFNRLNAPHYNWASYQGISERAIKAHDRRDLTTGRILNLDEGLRPFQVQSMPFDLPILFRTPALHGYGPSLPRWLSLNFGMNIYGEIRDKKDFFLRHDKLLRLLNVDYFFMDRRNFDFYKLDKKDFEIIKQKGNLVLARRKIKSNFAYFAKKVCHGDNSNLDIHQKLPDEIFVRNFLNRDGCQKIEKGHISNIKWDSHNPSEIVMECETIKGSFLVLSIPFDTHWKVWIDGKKNRVYKVNDLITGTYLPGGGKHKLRLRFSPF